MRLLIIIIVLFAVGEASGAGPDDVLGKYWTPKKDGQLVVYREGDQYFGRLVAFDVAGQLDEKNPDETLRSRPIVGVDLLASRAGVRAVFTTPKVAKRTNVTCGLRMTIRASCGRVGLSGYRSSAAQNASYASRIR
jgi:hypothetical protein